MADNIECPKCGKKAIVQCNENLYRCLCCDYLKDFSKPDTPKSDDGFFWRLITAIVLVVVFMWVKDYATETPPFETQPSSRIERPENPTS